MEKIIVTSMLGLLCSFTGKAQSQYESGMTQAFELWKQEKPEEAANQFERIARAEKENWIPFYYASQIRIIDAFSITDPVKKEKQLEKAQQLLDETIRYAGEDNVEPVVLQAMLHTGYITLDPQVYGMKLSAVVTELYRKAAEKHPENPRLALSQAEWNIGSARYFGEDPAQYCGQLEASLQLFREQEPSEPFAPQWGEDRARMLIASTCGQDGNTSEEK